MDIYLFWKERLQSIIIFLIEVNYLTYPGIPVIRKKIVFQNKSKEDLKLDNINIESLTLAWDDTHNVVYMD